MFNMRCALVFLPLTAVGATAAAAQGRATMAAHARVEEVLPSRKSLQAAIELVRSTASQEKSPSTPGARRNTKYGAVSVRPPARGDESGDPFELVATIIFW